MQPLALVFLDVDGVLCCNPSGVLETSKLLLLQKVIRQTGAKVVLSTNWRYYAELKRKLIRVLASFGIDCIGDTPNCGPDAQLLRPLEISSWLKAWNLAAGRPPIRSFVAVDDRLLTSECGGEQLKGHFAHTNPAQGITERVAQQMIGILMADNGPEASGDKVPSTAGTPRARSQENLESHEVSPPNTAPLSTTPAPLGSGKYDASKPESLLGRSPLTGMLLDPSASNYSPSLQTKTAFTRSQQFATNAAASAAPPPATHLYSGDGRRPFQQPAAFHPYKEGTNHRAQPFSPSSAPFTRSQAMAGRSPVPGRPGLSVRDNPRKWQPAHSASAAPSSPLYR